MGEGATCLVDSAVPTFALPRRSSPRHPFAHSLILTASLLHS